MTTALRNCEFIFLRKVQFQSGFIAVANGGEKFPIDRPAGNEVERFLGDDIVVVAYLEGLVQLKASKHKEINVDGIRLRKCSMLCTLIAELQLDLILN